MYNLSNICKCFTPEIFGSQVEELQRNQYMIKNKFQALVLLHTLHAANLFISPLELMYKIGWTVY